MGVGFLVMGLFRGSGLRCRTIPLTPYPFPPSGRGLSVWACFLASFPENRLNLACRRFRDTDGSYGNVAVPAWNSGVLVSGFLLFRNGFSLGESGW